MEALELTRAVKGNPPCRPLLLEDERRLSGAYRSETGRYVRRHDGTTRKENANRHKGLVDGA